MSATDILYFGELRLDLAEGRLWRGERDLKLTAKAFAVLRHLLTHPKRIVSKTELFTAVWPGVVVSDWALSTCIREIRRVLGDTAKTPQIIGTVYRQGYRFLPTITTQPVQSPQLQIPSSATQHPALSIRDSVLVGRDTELAQLRRWLEESTNGKRQLVFVTGEPGIGKTALVETFLAGIRQQTTDSRQRETEDWGLGTEEESQKSKSKSQKAKIQTPARALLPYAWLAWGQCIESYGAGEAYLPVLEALGRLARSEAGPALKTVLQQYAPTWLLHLPALLTAEEAAALQHRALGVRQERMVRELAEALEVLTAEQPLILAFEDLHWADASTLTLLSVLAHRRELARLFIVGTYRVSEAAREGSPLSLLTQDLFAHDLGHELALPLLDEMAVAAYLSARFPRSLLPTRFARLLHQRTDGNPLFVVSIVHDLIARGVITQAEETWAFHGNLDVLTQETPEGIRQMVTSQRVRLRPETRRVLEAASVAGMEFSAAEVAAALETAVSTVEEQCAHLAEQQQFLRPAGIGEWPDHTLTVRYAFFHALYQQHWHERVSPSRRQEWHQRIGERKETAYGDRTGEIAAELAIHFEQGRTYDKALRYLNQAAGMALRRSANPEAINHLTKALALLPLLPDTPERTRQELTLQVALGAPLMMTKGYTAPEVKAAYARAWELARETEETPQLFPLLYGLSRFSYGRNASQNAHELRERMLRLAHRTQEPSLLLVTHMMQGGSLFFQGEFVQAHTHAAQGITLYDPRQHRTLIFLYGDDPQVLCLCWAALALWYLGYPDQALNKIYQARGIAQELAHPFGLAFAFFWTAFLHQARGEVRKAREQTEALMALTQEHGIPQFAAMGAIVHSWTVAEQEHTEESITQLQQGIDGLRATRQELGRPYFLALLAEAYRERGQMEEGLAMVNEALEITHATGECMHQAELWRLKGELLLAKTAALAKE